MKPLTILDIESTGTSTVTDKIVQFACIKVNPDNGEEIGEAKNILMNPGIPISAGAMEVHGITEEMVKDKPTFSQYAKAIYEYLLDCDYGGFNIKGFDIPMLSEEFGRCGMVWPAQGARYFDAFHVFREKEKRDLTSAVRFYCGKEHDAAHDALGDVRASWDVIKGQMKKYEDIPTLETFAAFCDNPRALDLAARLVLNDAGVACFGFGKHEGKPVKSERGYANWMITSNTFPTNTVRVLQAILKS